MRCVILWQTFSFLAVGAQIPSITSLKSSTCPCPRFEFDTLGNHAMLARVSFLGSGRTGWVVDHLGDFFRTHKVKTQQMVQNRGQRCGDIELPD